MTDEFKTPSEREVVHSLIVTMKEHKRIFDTLRERTGLGRTAHRMLMILSDNPQGCSQTFLAEKIEISTAAVAVALKKMESDGYIMRAPSTVDSRLNTTVLTDKGKEIVEFSRASFSKIDAAMFEGFSDEEMQTLGGFIRRLHENIKKTDIGKDSEK